MKNGVLRGLFASGLKERSWAVSWGGSRGHRMLDERALARPRGGVVPEQGETGTQAPDVM